MLVSIVVTLLTSPGVTDLVGKLNVRWALPWRKTVTVASWTRELVVY